MKVNARILKSLSARTSFQFGQFHFMSFYRLACFICRFSNVALHLLLEVYMKSAWPQRLRQPASKSQTFVLKLRNLEHPQLCFSCGYSESDWENESISKLLSIFLIAMFRLEDSLNASDSECTMRRCPWSWSLLLWKFAVKNGFHSKIWTCKYWINEDINCYNKLGLSTLYTSNVYEHQRRFYTFLLGFREDRKQTQKKFWVHCCSLALCWSETSAPNSKHLAFSISCAIFYSWI